MKVRTALATAGTLLTLVALNAPAAHADPATMTHAEWGSVAEGMTKAKVNSICGCLGSSNGNRAFANGITWHGFEYQTPVGNAFVYYRINAAGEYRVGYIKYWCPGFPTISVENGGCERVSFL